VVVSGNGQSGQAGAALANPLVVRVTDAGGKPVVGASVNWVVAGGAGTLSATTTTTDASGTAHVA
jgi:hypothetical protein